MDINTLLDDNNISKTPFSVSLGESFTSIEEVLAYTMEDEANGNGTHNVDKPLVPPSVTKLIAETGDNAFFNTLLKGRKCRDSSLGGNDAVNCYPQFSRNDDIIHPITSLSPSNTESGMGRIYDQVYDTPQQVLYMTFGVPEFGAATDFYSNHIISSLYQFMSSGGDKGYENLGGLLGKTLGTLIIAPILPIKWTLDFLEGQKQTSITKYYDLRATMPLYYKCVNTMIMHLAVNMGLGKMSERYDKKDASADAFAGPGMSYGSIASDDPSEAENQGVGDGKVPVGLPEIFKKNGFDALRILSKKYQYKTGKEIPMTTDEMLRGGGKELTAGEKFVSGMMAGLNDANQYVGFRIEKSVDASESISNSTGESRIAQMLNSKLDENRMRTFDIMGGNLSNNTVMNFVEDVASGLKDIVTGALEGTTISGLSGMLTGNATIDIPEIWNGSSFDKSYSFNMKLRTPYGNPVSIMQNLYFPTALLLAGALPRAAGHNSYTTPFLVRAFSRGLFAIPLGIIDSMSIRRGDDQYGWSVDHLPTAIDISFTIKDLSPAMYMGIADSGLFGDAFAQNSSFQEYLMTLSGMGLRERVLFSKQIKRKIEFMLGQAKQTVGNPYYWSATVSDSVIGRSISTLLPTSHIPRN